MAYKKNREMRNSERDKKIPEMSIDEVKQYLCMKNFQNPEKCKGCLSMGTCLAGQRAVYLLNAAEQNNQKKGRGHAWAKMISGRTIAEVKAEMKETFEKACQQHDMIQWTMLTRNLDRKHAMNWLRKCNERFPDIAEKFSFNSKYNSLLTRRPTNAKSESVIARMGSVDDPRKYFETACQQSQMIQWTMQNEGLTRQQARSKLKYLSVKYPDIAEKYHFSDMWEAEKIQMKSEKKQGEQLMDCQTNKNDCELSVEDFLEEVGNMENVTSEFNDEITEPNVKEEITECDVKRQKMSPGDFYGGLMTKFDELERKENELKDKLAWIQEAKKAIEITAKLFNPECQL